jgi:hypothetical protein
MKLGPKQVQFLRGFLPSWREVRFGQHRNRVDLQETALVVEGELVRFHFLGLERFFERALSEWTVLTVPYSRIERVKGFNRGVLRAVSVSLLLAGWVGGGALAYSAFSRFPGLGVTFLVSSPLTLLLLYLNLRLKPFYHLSFRARDGRVRVLRFWVARSLRSEFATVLAARREAAARYTASSAPPVPVGR